MPDQPAESSAQANSETLAAGLVSETVGVDLVEALPVGELEREDWAVKMRIGPQERYQIEAPLDSGGFGQVYLARDTRLDRLCVVKRLLVGRRVPSLLASIEREAHLLVALNAPGHPNIPEIYDYVAEQCSLVMKHIAGQNLAQLAARQGGKLALRETLRYGQAVGAALAYLHSRSPEPVLHRDIKPANILIDETGRIWLIDFGFSQIGATSSTAAGDDMVGTLGFTPPEQWQGRAEPRSDIYALGATLLVLMTGYRPDRTFLLELTRGQQSFPRARQLDPAVDPATENLLARMLAREPVARPSAPELLDELAALVQQADGLPAALRGRTEGRRKGPAEIGAEERTAKEAVALLINRWSERSGLRKQSVASLAGFPDYGAFYRAYLDMSRGLNSDPALAIGVVRAFAEGLAAAQRCTAEEAISFLIQARLPIDRLREVAPFFTATAWGEAVAPHLGRQAAPDVAAIEVRLDQIAQALARSTLPPVIVDPLESAAALLAAMPVASAEPLPEPMLLPERQRMPLARNPIFVGRAAELRSLATLLREHPASHGGAVAITGMGGLGKTNLASELAHRYGRFFAGGVFWLNCADPQSLPTEVAECGAALLGDSGWEVLPLEERVRATRLAWQAPLPRLLIFDNCEDAELLMRWRPTAGGCRLLITSRRADWPRSLGVSSLALEPLLRGESLTLLGHYRPDLAATPARLNGLAAELGDLPLALHLAGSFLESYRGDPLAGRPTGLLEELRATNPLEHEVLQGEEAAPSATGHDLHIGRTFAVSLAHLDPEDASDSLARAVLARAAQLAPGAPFSRDLLAATVQASAPQQQRALTRAIRRLLGLGLLAESGELLRLHLLLAAYIQRAIDAPQAQAEVEEALIGQAEYAYEHEDFAEGRLALPHMQRLADNAVGRSDDLAIRLWNGLPFLLEVVGDRMGGLHYLERALAALVQAGTVERFLGGEVLNNLGAWHFELGNFGAARNYHERALAVRQRVLPADDPALAESHHNLADPLRETGDFAAARAHLAQAVAIWEAKLGPQDWRVSASRNNLGLLLIRIGDFAAAREQFATLLPRIQEGLGRTSLRVAHTHSNLAHALHLLGDLAQARYQIDLSLAIFREALGEQHPDLVKPLFYEALLIADERGSQAGIAALKAAIIQAEEHFGPEHTLAQRARAQLANLAPKA